MKLRHLILFTIACSVLLLGNIPGGSLLALFAWLQIYALMSQNNYSKKIQLWVLRLFLISLPLIIFWGSCHSFLFIYFKEQAWLYLLMSASLSFCLCLLGTIYYIFSFEAAETHDYQVLKSLQGALKKIKENRSHFLKWGGILFIFSLIPWTTADWNIVFAIMATHLILNRMRLRQVFASGF